MVCIQNGSCTLRYRSHWLAITLFCTQNLQKKPRARAAGQARPRKGVEMSKPIGATGPLAGLKVIDLTHVMAGPTCTLMLADMGAEVIKIEKAPSGDDTRHMIPPKIGEEAAAFLMMNRNKRGIAVDLKTEGGA